MSSPVPFESERTDRPPLEFEVRAAGPEDVEGIAAVWGSWHPDQMEGAQAGIAGEIGKAQRGEGRLVMVAVHAGRVVAYGRAKEWSDADVAKFKDCPAGWWLSGSVVLPEFRRRGIGRALMQRRLAALGTIVYSKVDLANEVSMAWHLTSGFVEVTRDFTAPGMRDDGEPMALLRWKPGG